MKKENILYKSIPFRILLLFNIKNVFHELVFLILNLILILSSIVFAIISSFFLTQESLIIGFNFYILFYISCLLFILILRMVQFFFHNKIEDKTIFITLSNQVSRNKLFISTWFLMLAICILNFIITFLLINLINLMLNGFELNHLLLKITSTFLIYGILCSLFLVNFIIFLIFIFSLQTTTVICTLLLSLTFVANLPMSFQKANEKNMTVIFKKENTNIQVKLTDLYDSFYLQKYVNEGNIKYSHLSKWINDKFIENNYSVNDLDSQDPTIHQQRINAVWKELGVIKTEPLIIDKSDLVIRSLPANDSTIPKTWSKDDVVNIDLTLNDTFISLEELEEKISLESNEEKKLILQDLYDFTIYINKEFFDIQKEKVDLFNEYIFIDSVNSKIINTSQGNEEIEFKKEYLKSIYNYKLDGSYNGDYFTLTDNSATEFVRTDLNFELMIAARILEDYFIKYTNIYLNAINYPVSSQSGDWDKYISSRKKLNIFSYFNFFNGLWSNYTLYSGFSYEDFWFLSSSESKISFDGQKNLFLGYPEFTFKTDESNIILEDSYNNYINPLIYVIILLIFSLFAFIFVIFKFQRIDLK